MPRKFKTILTCIVLSMLFGTSTANAQLLRDSSSLNLLKKNIDYIYNQHYNNAQEIYLKIQKTYPGHPVLFLLRGMQTYWKNYPLLNTNPAHVSFEEDLRQCIKLSEKNRIPENKAEYLLTNLCARGLLLEYYNDNNLTMEVIPLVTGTYGNLRKAFDYSSACIDLQYYTGVYNYYRDAYPIAYPIYKPMVLLLPSGNMNTGLMELRNSAFKGVLLSAESYYVLAGIYLNFENKYQQANYYCKSLHRLYPDNDLYQALYLKNLLLLEHYDEAEKLINTTLKGNENRYFQAQIMVLKGVLQEKKYHNNKLAEQYYQSGISKIAIFGHYGNEYTAYAYFGLSRLSYIKNETSTGKQFRGNAMKLATFKKINFDK